ncbi:MAG: hypothetical protein Q9163_004778 [Psora crenata]
MRPHSPRYHRKPSVTSAYPKIQKSKLHRNLGLVLLAVLFFLGVLFFNHTGAGVVTDLHVFHHNPAHKPPVQRNSTSGDVHWFSDWKWLKPFSASITLDDDRSALPPLKTRPPIYTFYDSDAEGDEKTKAAENGLLLLWRRAWWAQGFRPVVLGRSEAMNNPLYEIFRTKQLPPKLEADLVRWLAWEQMGTGILANWLVLPMGPHDHQLLSYLRRGEYRKLSRYEGLGSGLFSGERSAINAAIKEAFDSPNLKDPHSLLDAVGQETISVQSKPTAIAFYDANVISEHYKPIASKLAENKAEGLLSLAQLITAHLHLNFLSSFPDGFAVLTPYSKKAHIITRHAHAVVEALRSCPPSPIAESCPPNNPNCRPCSSIAPMAITTPEYDTNSSTTYTIGTIPHPYIFTSLLSKTRDITTRHIRRDTPRDRWLTAVTQKTLGREIGGPARIVSFKETVVRDSGSARGLWMTEEPLSTHKDMEYHFGFSLPPLNIIDTPATISIKETDGDDHATKKEKKAALKDVQLQKDLLDAAKTVLARKRKKKEKTGTKEMVEAWNLADTEAWRFVRAFNARERVERAKWEDEERRFGGGEGAGTGGAWRWFDRR